MVRIAITQAAPLRRHGGAIQAKLRCQPGGAFVQVTYSKLTAPTGVESSTRRIEHPRWLKPLLSYERCSSRELDSGRYG